MLVQPAGDAGTADSSSLEDFLPNRRRPTTRFDHLLSSTSTSKNSARAVNLPETASSAPVSSDANVASRNNVMFRDLSNDPTVNGDSNKAASAWVQTHVRQPMITAQDSIWSVRPVSRSEGSSSIARLRNATSRSSESQALINSSMMGSHRFDTTAVDALSMLTSPRRDVFAGSQAKSFRSRLSHVTSQERRPSRLGLSATSRRHQNAWRQGDTFSSTGDAPTSRQSDAKLEGDRTKEGGKSRDRSRKGTHSHQSGRPSDSKTRRSQKFKSSKGKTLQGQDACSQRTKNEIASQDPLQKPQSHSDSSTLSRTPGDGRVQSNPETDQRDLGGELPTSSTASTRFTYQSSGQELMRRLINDLSSNINDAPRMVHSLDQEMTNNGFRSLISFAHRHNDQVTSQTHYASLHTMHSALIPHTFH
eukprot:Gregarina_sp_Poly_1__4563@NODE_2448_length_2125_cov_105_216715_g1284_i1_p1_GENE_NODE_2448_length_2125_cov_105_216715_g1284_i1NODE_2448_length_2125_cov_105_216715_g1284_i1_p1_ORF_typecomplete_len419_score43_29PA26/PF04636_13/0_021_NODE_2448_length_2125_cov_105_216715_g1284_i18512107